MISRLALSIKFLCMGVLFFLRLPFFGQQDLYSHRKMTTAARTKSPWVKSPVYQGADWAA